MTVPFCDEGEAAICARVALAYLRLIRKRNLPAEIKPPILIGMAVGSLDKLKFTTIRSCYFSLNAWLIDGRSSKAWLTGVIYRDLCGYNLRRCLSESYKATRRDPRVTNRGVAQRALPFGEAHNAISDLDPGSSAAND